MPIYPLIILLWLTYLGYKHTKDTTITQQQYKITAVILILLATISITRFYYQYKISILSVIYTCCLILGFKVSQLFYKRIVTFNKTSGLLTIKGSFIPALIYISIFLLKFGIGFAYATNHLGLIYALEPLTGLFTAAFMSRVFVIGKALRQ